MPEKLLCYPVRDSFGKDVERLRRRIVKWILRILLLFLCYLVIGGLLPFVHHKSAGEVPVKEATAAGERVLLVEDSEDAFLWRLRLIESARQELVLSTFDFRADDTGGDILAALNAAADRGVSVRVLVDGSGPLLYFANQPLVQALAAHENVRIRLYNPMDVLRPWSFNPRLHDKYLLVDGRTYLLGGRNTNDLFLGEMNGKSSQDRDLLIWRETPGGTGAELQDYFEEIWALPCCKSVREKADPAALEARYRDLQARHPEAFAPVDWREVTMETRGVALIYGSPLPENKPPLVWKQLCAQMAQGQDVVIQTPYVICGREMYRDLTELSQGRNLEIVTNGVENGANPWGCADWMNQKDNILKTGAGVRALYTGHSVHTKTVLIDDHISIVGSFNLDMRSAYLDTEMMLLVDCPALNRQLREIVEQYPAKCFASDGAVTATPNCPETSLPPGKTVLYAVLRILIPPFRFLL